MRAIASPGSKAGDRHRRPRDRRRGRLAFDGGRGRRPARLVVGGGPASSSSSSSSNRLWAWAYSIPVPQSW